jgi:hypothetical protein
MTRGEMAAWLEKTPGEVYVPALVPHDVIRVRAHKGDLIAYLRGHPDAPCPWRVTEHDTYGKRAWHQIILDVDD